MTRVRRCVAILSLVGLSAGCGLAHLSELNFRTDNRLDFLTPKDRAQVTTPVRLSWTIRDFTVAAPGSQPPSKDAGYFAIFVDRAPIKPDQTMSAVGSGDPSCKNNTSCVKKAYLNDHQVYTTTREQLTIHEIQPLNNGDNNQLHQATIVLMDTSGHRIGESSWERDFKMRKPAI